MMVVARRNGGEAGMVEMIGYGSNGVGQERGLGIKAKFILGSVLTNSYELYVNEFPVSQSKFYK